MEYQVYAVSTDSPRQVEAHRKKNDFPFPLLSDSKMSGARALGIAFRLDGPTVEQYRKFGIDLSRLDPDVLLAMAKAALKR